MIYESVRKMTVKEQMAFDLGYAKALGEIERLTAELDAALRRAEAAVSDMVLAMENRDSLMSCEPCVHRGYDPCDGRFCKLKTCKPQWRGPEPGGEGEE